MSRKVLSLIKLNRLKEATKLLEESSIHNKKYFSNMIKEKKLRKDVKERFLDTGRYALELHEYEEAFYYFLAGKYVSSNPIFDYYLGKTTYKKGYPRGALNYFNEYRKRGSIKLNKCYFYLYLVTKFLRYPTCEYYYQWMHDINDFLQIEFIVKSKEEKVVEEDIIFKEDPVLSEKPYEEYSLEEKLVYIKNLLLSKREKEATKLLNKLQTTSKQERKKINQLINNKKLYLNKAK